MWRNFLKKIEVVKEEKIKNKNKNNYIFNCGVLTTN